MTVPIPYARQQIDEADIAAVAEILRSNWLTGGPVLGEFERAFAKTVGAVEAIACANGTAALHLSMLGLGTGEGERTKVIVPTMTFAASANAVRLAGGEVVFADVDPVSGLLTAEALSDALRREPEASAVIVVHLNGQCADLRALRESAGERPVVVDAAHALGSRTDDDDIVGSGRYATLTTFSFHPVKTITCGEGGMITTDSHALGQRLRRLLSHGITRNPDEFVIPDQACDSQGKANPWYYEMRELGLNYRLSDMQSALGLSQLKKLDAFVARRQALVAQYNRLLEERVPGIRPVATDTCGRAAWHLYPVLIDFPAFATERSTVIRRLRERGIGTQVHYLPVHRHPYYRERYGSLDLPGADAYYRQVLSLPLWVGLDEVDVERVVDALAAVLQT